ncbi:MAG: anthranilate synthase component I [Candidatus Omnitrophica bacterium]|nr:anthranilate synthase component I [Candidatus Omnitrophota bacterium]
MYYPAKEEFIKKAKQGNLIPVYKELLADLETPVSAFLKIGRGPYSYLLESVEGEEKVARYSFLGAQPALIFKSKGKNIELIQGKRVKRYRSEDPLSEIQRLMQQYSFVPTHGLPRFCGGLVGFMGYDMVRFFENIGDLNPDDLKLPDSLFLLTDTILIFDHTAHVIKIIANAHTKGKKSDLEIVRCYEEAITKIEKIAHKIKAPLAQSTHRTAASKRKFKLKSNLARKDFTRIVKKAKSYISEGEIIQTVLSQRFALKFNCPTFDIYRALRSINPSPYMYYLKLKDFCLVGSSPELFVRCEEAQVAVRPIAGTRPRGKDARGDQRLIKQLLADPKERAEHIMLVDLGRNDIGRVCDFASVKIAELMAIEKYSHVMHIVSEVRGKLRKDKDAFELIRACFPAGTVSGAPKVRAMEIIDELENVRRGPYAGLVGYFSFSGNLDSCITIRTIVTKNKTAYIQAGAGIVADSHPQKEYQETKNKAQAMIKAVELAERGGLDDLVNR